MIRLSVAVMAHPARAGDVPALLRDLDAPATVVWDEINDRWHTGRRSLLAFDPHATHHLVVQDDAILCRELVPMLEERVLEAVPDHPIALYTGAARPRANYVEARIAWAMEHGEAWLAMEGPLWGVAIVLPTRFIAPAVTWGDRHPEILNYDIRLARYFKSIRTSCFYTVPSLVDHRDGESLVEGRNGKGRKAFRFIGRHNSPRTVDWRALPSAPADGYAPARGGFACWTCPRVMERETQIRFHQRTHAEV